MAAWTTISRDEINDLRVKNFQDLIDIYSGDLAEEAFRYLLERKGATVGDVLKFFVQFVSVTTQTTWVINILEGLFYSRQIYNYGSTYHVVDNLGSEHFPKYRKITLPYIKQAGQSTAARTSIELPDQNARPFGYSVFKLSKKCGKKTCHCSRGHLHGPYWVVEHLDTNNGGRRRKQRNYLTNLFGRFFYYLSDKDAKKRVGKISGERSLEEFVKLLLNETEVEFFYLQIEGFGKNSKLRSWQRVDSTEVQQQLLFPTYSFTVV